MGLLMLSHANAQVDYLRNYEFLMDTTFKRAHPVKYAPGTTGDFLASSLARLPCE